MGYEKFTEGSNDFCKFIETSITMKTKADLDKELKNFLVKKTTIIEALDNEEATINAQLEVFK